jgi:hypothetical protein
MRGDTHRGYKGKFYKRMTEYIVLTEFNINQLDA